MTPKKSIACPEQKSAAAAATAVVTAVATKAVANTGSKIKTAPQETLGRPNSGSPQDHRGIAGGGSPGARNPGRHRAKSTLGEEAAPARCLPRRCRAVIRASEGVGAAIEIEAGRHEARCAAAAGAGSCGAAARTAIAREAIASAGSTATEGSDARGRKCGRRELVQGGRPEALRATSASWTRTTSKRCSTTYCRWTWTSRSRVASARGA